MQRRSPTLRTPALIAAFLLGLGVLAVSPANADERDCARIPDDAERLACYDNANRVDPPEPPEAPEPIAAVPESDPATADAPSVVVPSVVAPSVAVPSKAVVSEDVASEAVPPVVSSPVVTSPEADAPMPTSEPVSAALPPSPPSEPATTVQTSSTTIDDFGKPPETVQRVELPEVSAAVAEVEKTWPSGRWRYTLDNGQSWVQTRATDSQIDVGDLVTIRKRGWTHYLINDGGASFKVKRSD